MAQKILGGQTDFSYGEVDIALKRNDSHPARKAGLRQMANARVLNTGGAQNRSGRRALFPSGTVSRIEKFTISAGNNFKIGFAPGNAYIISESSVTVASFGALPWASQADINSIRWVTLGLSIYVCFGHAMRPQVITWDGVSTWSIADYTELVLGTQKRTPFYRISPKGIGLLPGARTGSGASLFASAPVFKAGHVGTRMRFINRQMLITAVADNQHATVTIEESLPGHQNLTTAAAADPRPIISEGDIVVGSSSGSTGIVTGVSATTIDVQLISTHETIQTFAGGDQRVVAFQTGEAVVGPAGSILIGNATAIGDPTAPVTFWDEEVINGLQGYPASCFVDQFRLGFCNFATLPGGIAWSAINSPTDLYVDVTGDNAIFEVVPANAQVQDVVPGAESSEFVFCDSKIYYIPITASSPLAPGSVSFQELSSDGAAFVQPRRCQEIILYANAGANSLMGIVATGAFNRPFNTKELSQFHQHLFDGVTAIAAPTADAQFNERYFYVLDANNGLVVGKYEAGDLLSNAPKIGWGPWNGVGTVNWVAAWNGEVHFTSSYFGLGICERLDDTLYLDCSLPVNAAPAAFDRPPGKGPLWFIPSQSVSLMDQGTRMMGTYQIDANGFIIPQGNGGEDLNAATLVAGQPWTMTMEPFAPEAPPGQDARQRMKRRRISQFAASVVNSTGFIMARLFSGPLRPNGPALGTLMNQRRVPAWNQDDDATKPPPLREELQKWSPLGASYDPRVAIVKDTPGPLTVTELGVEASI